MKTHQKFFVTFGNVIILTQWPLGEELTVNESTDERCELVRTRDDGDVRLILEDIDVINMNAPVPMIRGIRCYIQCCLRGSKADVDEEKESESDSSSGSLTRS